MCEVMLAGYIETDDQKNQRELYFQVVYLAPALLYEVEGYSLCIQWRLWPFQI